MAFPLLVAGARPFLQSDKPADTLVCQKKRRDFTIAEGNYLRPSGVEDYDREYEWLGYRAYSQQGGLADSHGLSASGSAHQRCCPFTRDIRFEADARREE